MAEAVAVAEVAAAVEEVAVVVEEVVVVAEADAEDVANADYKTLDLIKNYLHSNI